MNKLEAEYYANLELKPGSGMEEIKFSYKKMIKLYHPDIYQNNDEKRKPRYKADSPHIKAYYRVNHYPS